VCHIYIYYKIYLFLLVFMWVYSHKRNVAIDDKKKNGVCIAKKICVCEIEKLCVLCIEIVSAKKRKKKKKKNM
jgi:hypothetical protein